MSYPAEATFDMNFD